MYEGDDLNLVQDWVRQLPEMEHDLQQHVCACFRDELVDVEVLVELQAADFAYMGVTKVFPFSFSFNFLCIPFTKYSIKKTCILNDMYFCRTLLDFSEGSLF